MREMQSVEQAVREHSLIPQVAGKQIIVFCWNMKFSQCSDSELLPGAAPSMRKAIPVFCIGLQEQLFLSINN